MPPNASPEIMPANVARALHIRYAGPQAASLCVRVHVFLLLPQQESDSGYGGTG